MSTKCYLSPMSLGLAIGLTWGVSVLIMGLLATHFLYGTAFVSAMGHVYVGYEASILGSFIGGVIGFVDAFIVGAIIAWLYNFFSGSCGKSCK